MAEKEKKKDTSARFACCTDHNITFLPRRRCYKLKNEAVLHSKFSMTELFLLCASFFFILFFSHIALSAGPSRNRIIALVTNPNPNGLPLCERYLYGCFRTISQCSRLLEEREREKKKRLWIRPCSRRVANHIANKWL